MIKKTKLVIITLLIFVHCAYADEVLHVNVSQVEHNLPDMAVHFNIYNENDEVVSKKLQTENMIVHVDNQIFTGDDLTITAVDAVQNNCLFLVDVSTSMTDEQMLQIKAFIAKWTNAMTNKDTTGIVTFGEKITVVQDFSSNKNKILTNADALDYGQNATALYNGIDIGLKMLSQQQHSGQNMIIIFSDGQNYFSGGKTKTEITTLIENANIPIYFIGTVLEQDEEQQIYLDEMSIIARESGGQSYSQLNYEILDSYEQIKKILNQQQIINFVMDGKHADYTTKELSLEVEIEDKRMLSQKKYINDRQKREATVSETEATTLDNSNSTPDNDVPEIGDTAAPTEALMGSITDGEKPHTTLNINHYLLGFGAFLGLGLIFGTWLGLRHRRNNLSVQLVYQSPDMPTFKTYQCKIVSESITIGNGLGSTLLIDDRAAGKRHVMIYYERGSIFIEDFNTREGTLLNNKRLNSIMRLKDGDKFTIGSTDFEVIISSEGMR